MNDSNNMESTMIPGMNSHIIESNNSHSQQLHSQQLETLGLIAGNIAHDFNNLLTIIVGQASLTLAILPEENRARQHVEKIIHSAEFATSLTQELLEYASNKPSPPTPTNLNSLIQDNINLIGLSLFDGVSLQLNLENSLPFIFIKQTQVRQIIMNLLLNAAEAIQQPPGLITICTGQQFLDPAKVDGTFVSSYHLVPGNYAFFKIQDNGIGMDEATLSKIFKPFYTTKVNGRGLGLATMLSVIEDHDGAITVESKHGKGSTFIIYFPVHAKRAKLQ